MTQWEYQIKKVETPSSDDLVLQQTLDEQGDLGWELCTSRKDQKISLFGITYTHNLIFKRRIEK